MAFLRALACAAVVATSLAIPFPAGAGSTDVCAQRVIRDWYAGGRVDGVYPLRCYRAAIRALPEDVLQYSEARDEIERALAYATQGLPDPVGGLAETPAPALVAPTERPVAERSLPAARPGLATASGPATAWGPARTGAGASKTVRAFDGPVRVAAGSAVQVADARGLPYPVMALATLAALLLATAAAARLMTRRHGPGGTSDR